MIGQEVISTTGNYREESSFTISYTLGEVVVNTLESTSSVLTQGFHQPLIVSQDTTFIQELLDIEILVYPNPTNYQVIIKVDVIDGLHFMLFDLKGVLIKQNQILSEETMLDLSRLVPSTYILKIQKESGEARIFKIIKL